MNRRGLFSALLAAPAVAAIATAAPVVPPLVPALLPVIPTPEPVNLPASAEEIQAARLNLISDALVLLGVLCPGETPAKATLDFCYRMGQQQRPKNAHEFALILSPAFPKFAVQFIPEPFPSYMQWSDSVRFNGMAYSIAPNHEPLRFHPNSLTLNWPPVGDKG